MPEYAGTLGQFAQWDQSGQRVVTGKYGPSPHRSTRFIRTLM